VTRDAAWGRLAEPLDLLVIGGGVTGAGILLEAARRGLRVALVERGDFASGTSSRSSKLVHGGLRYLGEGRIGLARESVRERELLLRCAPGLVEPMPFLMPHYPGGKPGRRALGAGLAAYDLLAGRRTHRYVDRAEALRLAPPIASDGLEGAHVYEDATTDDARLVLRLIADACDAGAVALNYAEAVELLRYGNRVVGAVVRETVGGERTVVASARAVINATGAFADGVRARVGAAPRLRPLRGSHLLFSDARLPLAMAVAFAHPRDRRPVFAYPWAGMTLLGTTDLDHGDGLAAEPTITAEEVDYLLDAANAEFPRSALGRDDVLSTFAGVRPVIGTGKTDPSKEGREHAIWIEDGLVTVTGGKLTTFRPMALDALHAAARAAGLQLGSRARAPFAAAPAPRAEAPAATLRRIAGRYGARAQRVVAAGLPGEFADVAGIEATWAELRWAARSEAVVRLDDLLLRRTRIGLRHGDATLPVARVRAICAEELHWKAERWEREYAAYRELRSAHYGLPA